MAAKPTNAQLLRQAKGFASMYARRISNGHVTPVRCEELREFADLMCHAIQLLPDPPKRATKKEPS